MSVQLIIPECPWCNESLDFLRDHSHFAGKIVKCPKCRKPVKVTGQMVVTIRAERHHQVWTGHESEKAGTN